MSEPASLFVRLHLTRDARAAYFASQPPPPEAYPDWTVWAASRAMHGSFDVAGLASIGDATCETLIDAWCDVRGIPENALREEDEDTWTLSLLEFSENYGEMIVILSVLRAAAPFATPSTRSIAVVHDYMWGDTESDFALEITSESTRILDAPLADDLAEATARLDRHLALLQNGED